MTQIKELLKELDSLRTNYYIVEKQRSITDREIAQFRADMSCLEESIRRIAEKVYDLLEKEIKNDL